MLNLVILQVFQTWSLWKGYRINDNNYCYCCIVHKPTSSMIRFILKLVLAMHLHIVFHAQCHVETKNNANWRWSICKLSKVGNQHFCSWSIRILVGLLVLHELQAMEIFEKLVSSEMENCPCDITTLLKTLSFDIDFIRLFYLVTYSLAAFQKKEEPFIGYLWNILSLCSWNSIAALILPKLPFVYWTVWPLFWFLCLILM